MAFLKASGPLFMVKVLLKSIFNLQKQLNCNFLDVEKLKLNRTDLLAVERTRLPQVLGVLLHVGPFTCFADRRNCPFPLC